MGLALVLPTHSQIGSYAQFRIIGLLHGQMTTFVVEYRVDNFGEYIWVVTAWKSTNQKGMYTMNKQQREGLEIEAIAEMAQRGEDVSAHFTGQYTALVYSR